MNPSLWISKKKEKKEKKSHFRQKKRTAESNFQNKKRISLSRKKSSFSEKKKDISLSKEKTDSWFLSKTESHWKSLKSLDDSVKKEVLVCFQEI